MKHRKTPWKFEIRQECFYRIMEVILNLKTGLNIVSNSQANLPI